MRASGSPFTFAEVNRLDNLSLFSAGAHPGAAWGETAELSIGCSQIHTPYLKALLSFILILLFLKSWSFQAHRLHTVKKLIVNQQEEGESQSPQVQS